MDNPDAPITSKPYLPKASALIRLVAWALRSEVPQPVFHFPATHQGDNFSSFSIRTAKELGTIADSADKQADIYEGFVSRAKDVLSGMRALLAAYPAVAAMVPHFVQKNIAAQTAADDTEMLSLRGWGIDTLDRMLKFQNDHNATLSAREDPNAPLPERYAYLRDRNNSKFGRIKDIAKTVLIAAGTTAFSPITFPAVAAGYEPHARIKSLRLLSNTLRSCQETLVNSKASERSGAMEALLDASNALGAYSQWRDIVQNSSTILGALALERRERTKELPIGLIRHPDCGWHSDYPYMLPEPGEPPRAATEKAIALDGSDCRLASQIVRIAELSHFSEAITQNLASWLREQPPYSYQDWNSGTYAHAAAMSAIEVSLTSALYRIDKPAEAFARFLSKGSPIFDNPTLAVENACRCPISTALAWADKLGIISEHQNWPKELFNSARPILACAGIQLWLCSPENIEYPVAKIAWHMGVTSDSPFQKKILESSTQACAPIALRFGLSSDEFSQAIAKAIDGTGGVRINPNPVYFDNPEYVTNVCAGALATAQAKLLKEYITPSEPHLDAATPKLRL